MLREELQVHARLVAVVWRIARRVFVEALVREDRRPRRQLFRPGRRPGPLAVPSRWSRPKRRLDRTSASEPRRRLVSTEYPRRGRRDSSPRNVCVAAATTRLHGMFASAASPRPVAARREYTAGTTTTGVDQRERFVAAVARGSRATAAPTTHRIVRRWSAVAGEQLPQLGNAALRRVGPPAATRAQCPKPRPSAARQTRQPFAPVLALHEK